MHLYALTNWSFNQFICCYSGSISYLLSFYHLISCCWVSSPSVGHRLGPGGWWTHRETTAVLKACSSWGEGGVPGVFKSKGTYLDMIWTFGRLSTYRIPKELIIKLGSFQPVLFCFSFVLRWNRTFSWTWIKPRLRGLRTHVMARQQPKMRSSALKSWANWAARHEFSRYFNMFKQS